jgi:hypothetical protein
MEAVPSFWLVQNYFGLAAMLLEMIKSYNKFIQYTVRKGLGVCQS